MPLIELAYTLIAPVCAILLVRHSNAGSQTIVVSPIVAYVVVEVFAVWYALSPFSSLTDDFSLFVIASLAIISLAAGYISIELLLGRRLSTAAMRSYGWGEVLPVVIPASLLAIALTAMSYLEIGIPRVDQIVAALIDPAAGQADLVGVNEVRRSTTKGHFFGGEYRGQGVRQVVSDVGWRYLVALTWLAYWRRKTGTARRVAVISSALALTFLIGTGVRSSIIFLLVVLVIARTIIAEVDVARLARYGLGGFLLMVVVAPLSKGASGNEDVVSRIGNSFDRLARGNSTNNVAIVNLINDGQLDPGHGSVLGERFRAILPGVGGIDRPFANRLAILMGGSTRSTTYATPTQLGIWYADFRSIGVVIGYYLTGASLALATTILAWSRAPHTEYRIAYFASAIFSLGYWSISGPSGVVANLGVLTLLHASMTAFARFLRNTSSVTSPAPALREARANASRRH